MKPIKGLTAVTATALLMAVTGMPVSAEEATPGTQITAANIDNVKEMTFEGKRLGDMIPERLEWQIRNHNLQVTLRQSKPHPVDPRMAERTKQFSDGVKFDPVTKNVTGYRAGVPFPQIDQDDPHAAYKILWNYIYGQPRGDIQEKPFAFLFIEADVGLERLQTWTFRRYFYKGGYVRDAANVDPSASDVLDKLLLWARTPHDVKGLGTYTIRYDSGKLSDVWAYIRTVRRVRRLSGGAWMDPVGGSDFLQDDISIFNAHPSWYTDYKILGKQTVLAVVNSRLAWNPDAGTTNEKFPLIDLSAPPYWNPKDVWEPRDVYVIDTQTPPEHPYSRKIVYITSDNWLPVFGQMYDRKGDFWKWAHFSYMPFATADGGWSVIEPYGLVADFQRRHGSMFIQHPSITINPPNITENDVSLAILEAGGQ